MLARAAAPLTVLALIAVGCTGGQTIDQSKAAVLTSTFPTTTARSEPTPSTSVSETSIPATQSTSSTSTTVSDACDSLIESTRTVEVEATERSFDLVLPTDLSPDRPAPILVLLHGFNGQAATIASRTNLVTLAPNAGVVLAVPQGIGEPTTWHYDAGNDLGDAELIDALLDRLSESPCIDASNIWLGGFSAGSGYTAIFGCPRAERFAGLLMVSGLAPPICPENSGLELMIFHGIDDPIVPFDGGAQPIADGSVELATIPESAAGWAQQAGCGPTSISHTFGETNRSIATAWDQCSDGSTVRLVAIEGLGHTWPVSSSTATPIVDASCAVVIAMTEPTRDPIASCLG